MVTLLITVGPDGRPQAARLLRSSGHVALDEAARQAVLSWRFRPALRGGQPVQGEVSANVIFRLQ